MKIRIVWAGLLIGATALAGCAGQSGATPKSSPTAAQREQAFLKFAQCMRDHGVDMPDPKFGQGGGMFQIGGPGSNVNPDSPRFQAAQKACDPIMQKVRDKIGGPGPSTTRSGQ